MENEVQNIQINGTRVKPAEYQRTVWAVTVEQGVLRETLKQPGFWAHVAREMKPYDKIEVRCDDGSFFGELLVLDVGRAWVKVRELSFISLTNADVSQTQAQELEETHEVKWKGPHNKWCVIRKGDNELLKKECQSQDEAVFWLKEHLKAVDA